MYVDLIQELKTIFEGIVIHQVDGGDDLKLEVYPHPLKEGDYPDNYPAVVFYPSDYTNEFASNQDNFKQLKFTAVLMVNAESIGNDTLFTFTLPNAADKVLDAIDKQWNMETINGNRTWMKTDVGVWGKQSEDAGEVGFVDMDIVIKFENKVE